ncbi:MAG: response regulator [bacterium]
MHSAIPIIGTNNSGLCKPEERRKNMTKVLIVDDEIYFATNIANLLRANNEDMDALAVYSAEEALKQLEKAQYDIVVTDIRMPKINGFEFIKLLKQKWPNVSVIVMTAYGAKEVMENAFSLGTLFYIEKPFRVEKLEALLAIVSKKIEKKASDNKLANAN